MLLNRDVVSFLPAYLYLLPEGLKQAVRPVSYAMPWVLVHDSMQPVSANPYYLPNVRGFTDLKGQCHEKVFQLRYEEDIYPPPAYGNFFLNHSFKWSDNYICCPVIVNLVLIL